MADASQVKLTPKQEAFCRAMITEEDQASAYRIAYNPKKMTDNAVYCEASKMMRIPKIAHRVKELRDAMAAQALMEKQEWLERVTKIARADVRKMFDSHGNPIEISQLESNEAAAIAGFEFCEDFTGKEGERTAVGYTKKFKLADKIRALELVGKAYRYLGDDKMPFMGTINQTNITVNVAPAEAYQRMLQGA